MRAGVGMGMNQTMAHEQKLVMGSPSQIYTDF